MTHRKGSNQYKTRHAYRFWKTIYLIAFISLLTSTIGFLSQRDIKTLEARHKIISPLAMDQRIVSYQEAGTSAEQLNKNLSLQEKIDKDIQAVFGKNAKVAKAVQKAECNPRNKQYPACVADTSQEYSVGIFQINLKVHANKVPGDTIEEKIAYLKNPFNNALVAKSIFADSGWYPWSTYTNGAYLAQL